MPLNIKKTLVNKINIQVLLNNETKRKRERERKKKKDINFYKAVYMKQEMNVIIHPT